MEALECEGGGGGGGGKNQPNIFFYLNWQKEKNYEINI
jgi:hypothetical protein